MIAPPVQKKQMKSKDYWFAREVFVFCETLDNTEQSSGSFQRGQDSRKRSTFHGLLTYICDDGGQIYDILDVMTTTPCHDLYRTGRLTRNHLGKNWASLFASLQEIRPEKWGSNFGSILISIKKQETALLMILTKVSFWVQPEIRVCYYWARTVCHTHAHFCIHIPPKQLLER